MNTADTIALWQLIISAANLFIVIAGGILGILAYFKVIRSTDENAKMRQADLEKSATILQQLFQSFSTIGKRNTFLMGLFAMVMILAFVLSTVISREKIKELENNK